MASKDSSFDVVSQVDMQEVDNAFQQTLKEMTQRYDLKGSNATLDLDKQKRTITVTAPSEFVCKQIIDVLNTRLIRRKVDISSLSWGTPQAASGAMTRMVANIVEGIDQDLAKKIAKDIRDQKLKVKASVEGDKLKVSSPSKDDLQAVIKFLREQDYGQPLQYENYR